MNTLEMTLEQRVARLLEDTSTSLSYEMTGVKMELSEIIYQLMTQTGLSKDDLARELDISKRRITKIFQGDDAFDIELIVRIARIIGYKIDVWKMFVPRTTATENT